MAGSAGSDHDWDNDGNLILTGSANAYVAATARKIKGYYEGLRLCARANFTNTGAATITVDEAPSISLRKPGNGALVGGEVINGGYYDFIYDLANNVMQVATASGNGSITNAQLADMVQATIKGRAVGAGTGAPTDLTATQATAILDAFTSALKGLAPASGGGSLNFLRADGTWNVPPGTAPPWTLVMKAADQSKISDTAYATDNTLTFAMLASTAYQIRGTLFVETNTTAEFKFQFTGPASPTQVRAIHFASTPGGIDNNFALDTAYSVSHPVAFGAAGAAVMVDFRCNIKNGTNAGNFNLQWAQNVSTAVNTTILSGSYIEYRAAV